LRCRGANLPARESRSTLTAQEAYFYGLGGQKLGTYSLVLNGSTLTVSNTDLAVFFGGKRVAAIQGGTLGPFIQDRLGSNGKYFPYGEDRNAPANDQVKFATYTRDSATGLDYADQRYYSNQFGRFMSPDRYWGSASLLNPQSWNRYAYVLGDPINHNDPFGLCDDVIAGINESSTDNTGEAGFANSIGAMQAYRYAGTDVGSGVGEVGIGAATSSTWNAATVAASINEAAQDSSGPINLFIFSGGAQAFSDALSTLSASVVSRIASITYASPGMIGTLATVNGIIPTVILGAGGRDAIATAGTVIPSTWNVIQTACGHDAGCEFEAANAASRAGNHCNNPAAISSPIQPSMMQAIQQSLAGLASLVNMTSFNPFVYLNTFGGTPMYISDVFSTISYPAFPGLACVTTPGLNGGAPETVCQ
jgi:RHS repeat-associated protein